MFDRTFLKGIRDQMALIDKQIASYQTDRIALATLLREHDKPAAKPRAAAKAPAGSATSFPGATPTEGSTAPAAPTGGPRKNYIGVVLPEIARCGGTMSVSAMRSYLAAQPGLEAIKLNNLNAAIQNELKKGEASRIVRVEPGVYGIAWAEPAATLPDDMPNAPEQAPEAVAS